MPSSKRYQPVAALVEPKKTYSTQEAIDLVKKTATEHFDAAVELHARLGVDPKKGDQQVRGTVSLPHGTGKTRRVAVFCEPDKEKEAKDAGADIVGAEELVTQVLQSGKCNFDVAVATPSMMPKIAKLAKLLGPKGLMPNPKNETVTPAIGRAVTELKAGKITFKNDDTGNVHAVIGRISFTKEQLTENFNAFMDVIKKLRPASAKGTFIRALIMTSSMGPAIRVQISF